MDSARSAIDTDNVFYLYKFPHIDGLLKTGLTLYVDKDFPKYHELTLIQYAIAKRKPRTLKFMLEKTKELNIEYKNIMYPNCSNTRGSLLRLAIEFGSQEFCDTVDNSCLITILDVLDVTNFDSKNILYNSLFLAIKNQNDEAVEILINKGANFTEQLGNEDNEISNDELLETPIMKIFKLFNDKDQLQEIFDKYFKENGDEIIKRLIKLKVDNSGFLQFLSNVNLNGARSFIIEFANKKKAKPNKTPTD